MKSATLKMLTAGVAIGTFLFSCEKAPDIPDAPGNPFAHIFRGGYPPIYDRGIRPTNWYAQYTQSYLERDVRQLVNVGDLETFGRFLRLTAKWNVTMARPSPT